MNEEDLSIVGETAADQNLNVTFYNTVNENGEEVEYVRISIPGNTATVIEEPVNEGYKARFKTHYEVFKKVREMTGTPIEQWEDCPEPMQRELKKLEFNYVEQLANAPDNLLLTMMGGQTWRLKAQRYLEKNRVTPEMIMNAQQAQINELKEIIEAMKASKSKEK